MFWMGTGYMDTVLALQAGSLTKYLTQRDQPRQNTEQQLKEIRLGLIVIDKTIRGLKKNLLQENNFEIFVIPIKATAYTLTGKSCFVPYCISEAAPLLRGCLLNKLFLYSIKLHIQHQISFCPMFYYVQLDKGMVSGITK